MADDAQRAVLGAILIDPRCADSILEQLTEDDFAPGRLQNIFLAVVELRAKGWMPIPASVLSHLQQTGRLHAHEGDIGPFLFDLVDQAMIPVAPQQDVSMVIEQSVRQRVWDASTRWTQALRQDWPMPAVLNVIDREFNGVMQAVARLHPADEQAVEAPAGIPGIAGLLETSSTDGTAAA